MNQNNELYHHGILGMKWGRRRYQNKDGSRTPAGRKRYGDFGTFKKKVSNATEGIKRDLKKSKNSTPKNVKEEPKKPKTVKEMTNEELKERTTRLRLENDYTKEMNNYKTLHPQKVSAGRKFVTYIGKDVITPAAAEAGRNFLKNYMDKVGKEALGLDQPSPYEKLKKEVDMLELKKRKKIAENYLNKK